MEESKQPSNSNLQQNPTPTRRIIKLGSTFKLTAENVIDPNTATDYLSPVATVTNAITTTKQLKLALDKGSSLDIDEISEHSPRN